MTGPSYFPRPPRPPGKSQPAPTFHTLTRWLTPWRTIRLLEAENQQLREHAVLRSAILRGELETAREALRRVTAGGWYKNSMYSVDYHDRVVEGVRRWVRDGMTGPLPPLPDHMVNRQPTTTEDQLTTEGQP
jgi:hypothetical protein